jgi:hypothetical protein
LVLLRKKDCFNPDRGGEGFLQPPEIAFSDQSTLPIGYLARSAPRACVSMLNTELFCNDHGSIRLRRVQSFYGYHKGVQERELSAAEINNLVDLFVYWRDLDEVVPMKYVYRDYDLREYGAASEKYSNFIYEHTGNLCIEYGGFVLVPVEKNVWRFVKACKRGNEVYLDIVRERFKPIIEREPRVFFTDWGVKSTPMLYITVTTDPSTVGIDRGWLGFGERWNKFITNLRNQFGELVYVRAWQSQKNGLPHAHALVYFCDREFSAVYWEPDGTYRLPSRSKHRSSIKKAWKWGHCDIVCVQDTQQLFKDLLKYVLRDLEGGGE